MIFPHKLSFWMQYADMIIEKGVPFFSKLAKGWEQLGWLVKKRAPFSQNNIFKKVYFFEIYTIYASFNANK